MSHAAYLAWWALDVTLLIGSFVGVCVADSTFPYPHGSWWYDRVMALTGWVFFSAVAGMVVLIWIGSQHYQMTWML